MKPQNVLLAGGGRVLLADFGLARSLALPARTLSPEVVTLWDRPPELLLGARAYGPAVDLWSVGCVAVEMVLGAPPFRGVSAASQLRAISAVLGAPPGGLFRGLPLYAATEAALCRAGTPLDLPAAVRGVVGGLLVYDPAGRLTAPAALEDAFLSDRH